MKKIIITVSSILALSAFATLPVFGQSNIQSKDDKQIDQRVEGLNRLLARIQEMKKISDSQKSSISLSVQNVISGLTTLKAKIAADVSSSTLLKEDTRQITEAYRIYALVMPQISIVAAADRVVNTADMMSATGAKIQARLTQATNITDKTKLQTSLTDMAAKIADANIQAQAAVNKVVSLVPDQGDKTIQATNNTALKNARLNIQIAKKDLAAARKDADTVIKALKKEGSASSTEATSSDSH